MHNNRITRNSKISRTAVVERSEEICLPNVAISYALTRWNLSRYKMVQTARIATCLSRGPRGQVSRIRVHGTMKIPIGKDDLDLPMNGTQWFPVQNDLGKDLYETDRATEYTIFIECLSTLLFAMNSGEAKEAAQKFWK